MTSRKSKDPGNKKLMTKKEPEIVKVARKRTKSIENYASRDTKSEKKAERVRK